MKIAFVTTYNARDVKNWSGTGFHMANALKKQLISLEYIGPLNVEHSALFEAKRLIYKYFFNKNYLLDREPFILRNYARQVSRKLAKLNVDVIFSPGTIPIAYLNRNKPLVFWADATFAGMIDFYPYFSNLCKETIVDGNKMEKSALNKCALAIYSSEWAAQTAVDFYKIDRSKVKVVPFGANIDTGVGFNNIKKTIAARSRDKCKLLFFGVDWKRKGGDIAVEIAGRLNKSGLRTELTVVGVSPIATESLPPFVKFLGFISKSSGQEKIRALFAESHFLILPSRADCTPIVLCEAASFGVPCLSTNVGGIPTIIKDGLNGKIFAKDADTKEYCRYILDLFFNYEHYRELAISSFNEYQLRLNWDVAGRAVKKLLMELDEVNNS